MSLQDAAAFVMGISGMITQVVVLIFVYEAGCRRDDVVELLSRTKKKAFDDE